MRAVIYERHGGPDELEYKEVPDPDPAEDEVLVKVEAIGVNFRDVYEREGKSYAVPPPAIIGVEGAGRIVDTGERVAWVGAQGSYAELVTAPRERLVPVPDSVSSEDAAAAMLQGMTAHYLTHDSYPVEDGDWVLVHAGAGGVGQLLIQMARLRGGRVIATCSPEKAGVAREAGANEVIEYDGFAERARDIAGGMGMAAIYDGVGKSTFMEGLDALAPTGRMILYGAASGQPDPLEIAVLGQKGSLYVQRPTLQTYTRSPELLHDRAEALFELIGVEAVEVRIGAKYPLSQARQAQEDLEARRTTGKLLLIP